MSDTVTLPRALVEKAAVALEWFHREGLYADYAKTTLDLKAALAAPAEKRRISLYDVAQQIAAPQPEQISKYGSRDLQALILEKLTEPQPVKQAGRELSTRYQLKLLRDAGL